LEKQASYTKTESSCSSSSNTCITIPINSVCAAVNNIQQSGFSVERFKCGGSADYQEKSISSAADTFNQWQQQLNCHITALLYY